MQQALAWQAGAQRCSLPSHLYYPCIPLSPLTSSPPASRGPQMPGRDGAWKSPVTVHATAASAGQERRQVPRGSRGLASSSRVLMRRAWAAQATCSSTQPAPTAAHSHPPPANRTCRQEADQPLAENDGAHALAAVHAVVIRQEKESVGDTSDRVGTGTKQSTARHVAYGASRKACTVTPYSEGIDTPMPPSAGAGRTVAQRLNSCHPSAHLSARTVMRDRLLNSAWHKPTVTPSRLRGR